MSKDPNHPSVLLFKIAYEDDNTELVQYEDLKKILVTSNYSAACYTLVDPAFAMFSTVHCFDFETPPAPYVDFDNMNDADIVADGIATNVLLSEVSEQVFRSAAASKCYKSISP